MQATSNRNIKAIYSSWPLSIAAAWLIPKKILSEDVGGFDPLVLSLW